MTTSMRWRRASGMPLTLVVLAVVSLAGCALPGDTSRTAASERRTEAGTPLVDASGRTPAPAGSCHYRGDLPDASCTPGEADPRVTQANILETICVSGYSAGVRPPLSVTEPIKRERVAAYGVSFTPLADEELDHLLPLSLGGASTTTNLWPQPLPLARKKDELEVELQRLVCDGRVDLATAQHAITTDWVSAYQTYVGG